MIKKFKSGFVTIIGRPNVGKSTLLNTIVQKKVAIVTNKAQTTRNKIQGVYNDKESQIILVDTPGIHKHKNVLGKYMNKTALNSIKGIDIILFVFPVNEKIGENDKFILKQFINKNIPVFLVLSKSDLSLELEINKKLKELKKMYNFTKEFVVSSLKEKNISKLIENIKLYLPEGPKYFFDDIYTDQPESFIIKEIIREKILKLTDQEIPHSSAIIINKMEDTNKILKIYASIIVERNSQKPIIIGKHGKLIKEIGINSRLELEKILNTKIHLDLFVKVVEKWRNDEKTLKKICYNKNSY